MSKFVWFGTLMLVAVASFPFVPESPVSAVVLDATTQRARPGSPVGSVIRVKGPLEIAVEARLRWLGLR
jgi:hypothetical protein